MGEKFECSPDRSRSELLNPVSLPLLKLFLTWELSERKTTIEDLFSISYQKGRREPLVKIMAEKQGHKPRVVFTRWNPYLVIGAPPCTNSKGEEIHLDTVTALCRCGASNAKPYCDGSHSKVGFSGEKAPDRKEDKVIEYKGQYITILDNSGVCASDSACTDNCPEVFKSGQKPWIHPDGADVKKIVETIEQCPSGALSYRIGTQRVQNIDRSPVIKVAKDGPLEFVGFIELIDDMGSRPESEEHYTLCRCGESKNKPFCDARHKKAGFKDDKN